MDELYERNNIYFMYCKEDFEHIYILIDNRGIFSEFNSNCIVGIKEELYSMDDIVIAPIDILLYHVPDLEYLHKDYTLSEMNLRKSKKIGPNLYRKLKYAYSKEELVELYTLVNSVSAIEILDIVKKYSSYFEKRKKDSVLRIYTNYC